MTINVNFTKPVPNELYIDSFTNGNTKTWTYTGNNILHLLVEKRLGDIAQVHDDLNFNYNSEFFQVITIDASVDPDVAYFASNTHIPDRIFVTETLVDGSTYEQITNPTLRDIYNMNYNFENSTWNWTVKTVEPRTMLNDYADRNREYINSNISKISGNATLTQLANDYLQELDTFESTGSGSIPSWKKITHNLSDVPRIPQDLIVAFNVLP
jgi:hypothetical protein